MAKIRKNPLSYQRLIVISNVSLFVVSCILFVQAQSASPSLAPVQPQNPFKVGQVITQGSASVHIDAVRFSTGKSVFTAKEGMQYAIVTLSVANNTDSPIQVLPTTDTYIKDSSGNSYLVSPFGLESPFRAGELSPGETIRGELSYLVPRDGKLKYFIDAPWSGSVLPFAINQ